MFQTHCYDSWLGGGARKSTFFMWSQLGGTLPAPLFLFLAGISFALVTDKLRQRGADPNQVARTTILRGAEIFGLGLLFRLQEFLLGFRGRRGRDLLRVDILNTIGLSMMLMGVMCRLAGGGRGRSAAVAVRSRARDLAGHAAGVDICATARAAVAARVLHQRRTHLQAAAGVAVPDFSLGGICLCRSGNRLPAGERLGAEARGKGVRAAGRRWRRDHRALPAGSITVRGSSMPFTTSGTPARTSS